MSFTFNLHVPKALPPLPSSSRGTTSLFFSSKQKSYHNNTSPCQSLLITCRSHKPNYDDTSLKYTSLALQVGALLALLSVAVTGENNRPELIWVLTQWGVVLFGYFLVVPPIIFYWLWKRWYRRNLLEMYLQFMCVFIFFPGKFPRDTSLQYPWSVPEDPSKIRSSYAKYPYAEPEDYDNL
ncbi:hypothetical protein GLYMA_08G095100v4 [Glycine max]|uniref:Uncharacterized protein n=1 Tax=Glycine max TaxID=3847 RepID=A0A0R0IJG2_SOYBN|nr:hypothetical protein GYH30_020745 [Glycine max]KRH42534.1 hypothetical protein GLYMA_08G095100v4 [Glycine max]